MVEGIIYTNDNKNLTAALEAMGLIVREIIYEGPRTVRYRVSEGVACVYNLLNGVKIRIVISDELIGTIMENLRSFGNCDFVIISEEHFCLV
jgi:nitrogen regulatory protein PII